MNNKRLTVDDLYKERAPQLNEAVDEIQEDQKMAPPLPPESVKEKGASQIALIVFALLVIMIISALIVGMFGTPNRVTIFLEAIGPFFFQLMLIVGAIGGYYFGRQSINSN